MVQIQGRRVTFIPPKEAQYLIGDFTDWDHSPLPIHAPLTLEFPEGAYVEYAFMDEKGRPFPDPDNPEKAENPWWSYPRAVRLPGYVYEAPPAPKEERGRLHRHRKGERLFYVYEPPLPPKATLVAQDGVAFYRIGELHRVTEALWERGEVPPLRIVFVEPADRRKEYWFNEAYEAELLALLQEVQTLHGPLGEVGLVGASLGGLFSLWMALRQGFPKVLALSPALKAHPKGGDTYQDPEWLTAVYQEAESGPRVYLEVGLLEWLLAPNRRFAAVLAEKGFPHAYRERPSGHNWVTWKQALAPGLRYLYT
ncbi:MAG: alpha/beta hydrolase-fold protein [Thermaceae bacterium]